MRKVRRAKSCDERTIAGRLSKAEQFWDAAALLRSANPEEVGDAYVSLCVLAGIAAADVICCRKLGVHSIGDSHEDAVGLLGNVDRRLAAHLQTLLGMKSNSAYGSDSTTTKTRVKAERAALTILRAARQP